MSAPLTPEQEARIREIVREEIDAMKVMSNSPVTGPDPVYVRAVAYDRLRFFTPAFMGRVLDALRATSASFASPDQAPRDE